MEESILNSVKKILNVPADDESFDLDIITHINSAFSNLQQLGIGPVEGFWIESADEEWAAFGIEARPILNQLKTCIYLRVRLLFDPPPTSFVIASLERQVQEHEWRLSAMREATEWVDPDPPVVMTGE